MEILARKIGKGATSIIRRELGFEYFRREIPVPEEVELQELSSEITKLDTELERSYQITDIDDVIDNLDSSITKIVENNSSRTYSDIQTQTDILNFRELEGLDRALQRTRGELVNNLAKLTYLDEDIAKEKQKLAQIRASSIEEYDEELEKTITDRIKSLEEERAARLEVASSNKDDLRSQISRIKETIAKILQEDKTLGEKLRTLFREQGITIFSILTAFGMIIATIVEAVVPRTGETTGPPSPPSPSPKGGIKEWIKKQLINLGNLLAKLAGKAAAALPGIIGSIVSWLLSTTGKVINWFANNLWALLVLVVGLMFSVASKEIKNYNL